MALLHIIIKTVKFKKVAGWPIRSFYGKCNCSSYRGICYGFVSLFCKLDKRYVRNKEPETDVFCFCLPCIATLVIGIAVMTDFLLLPIVITAALLAGTSGLLVSWTSDQKEQAKKNREIKNYTVVILIPRHSPTFRSVSQIS